MVLDLDSGRFPARSGQGNRVLVSPSSVAAMWVAGFTDPNQSVSFCKETLNNFFW
jgi:hypothetical protein